MLEKKIVCIYIKLFSKETHIYKIVPSCCDGSLQIDQFVPSEKAEKAMEVLCEF